MTKIQLRRGAASLWTSQNPVLADGEIGWDSTNQKFKIGNGTANWATLPYAIDSAISGKANIASPTFTGVVGGITKSMVGLSNVDNTTDMQKPVSTLVQTALADKLGGNAGVIFDTGLPTRLRNYAASHTDWNTCMTTGWYMAYNVANAPTTNTWYIGSVEAHNNLYVTQTVHAFTSDSSADTKTYRRDMTNNVWSSWYKLLLSQEEQDARYQAIFNSDQITEMDKLTNKTLGRFFAGIANRNARSIRIVGAGSSTTAGGGASAEDKRFFNILAKRIQQAYPLDVGEHPTTRMLADAVSTANGLQFINAGVWGAYSDTYLTATTGPQVGALNPTAVIHMVGSNDWASSAYTLAQYKANLLMQVDRIDAAVTNGVPPVHIFVHPYQRWDQTGTVATWSQFGATMKECEVARPGQIIFFNIDGFYSNAGIPGNDIYDLIGGDLIHQTDAGHAMMADLIRRELGVADQGKVGGDSYTGGGAPAIEPNILSHRQVSDTFVGGTGTNIGARVSDNHLGGSTGHTQTWTADNSGEVAFTVSGNAMVANGAQAHFAGFAVGLIDCQVSYDVAALPTSGQILMDLYRGSPNIAGPPNSYRLIIDPTQIVLAKRVSGVVTVFWTSTTPAQALNKRLTLRYFRGRISALIEGVTMFSVVDSSVAVGNYCGIAHTGGVGGWRGKNFAIDALAY